MVQHERHGGSAFAIAAEHVAVWARAARVAQSLRQLHWQGALRVGAHARVERALRSDTDSEHRAGETTH